MKHTVSACKFMEILELSMAKAEEAMDLEYQKTLHSCFQEDGTPKTFRIQAGTETLSVPRLCMTRLNPLSLKAIHLNFDCCIEGIRKGELMLNLSKDDSRLPMHVEIILQSEAPSEGIMRINDKLISEYLP